MKYVISQKSSSLNGTIKVPGDKSISHRALIISSMCIGTSKIDGLLESEDVFSTMSALKSLGVKIRSNDNSYFVEGVGICGYKSPNNFIDLGNSGTGIRLLLGAIMGSNVIVNFKGDDSLSKRPMERVLTPLRLMGANLISSNEGKLPVSIQGPKEVLPINYSSKISSAQIKSAVLLSGLCASGKTIFTEPNKSRNHTEKMLSQFGANISSKILDNGSNVIELEGRPHLVGKEITVPCDPSSASFPIVAAIITPNSKIELHNVMINHARNGLFETLQEMGAKLKIFNEKKVNNEFTASIYAEYSKLKGLSVPSERAPRMIDEYPILSMAAACAEGRTTMNGISELRVKESDRIKIVSNGLNRVGIKTIEKPDSLKIFGGEIIGGCTIDSELDHRIAMSFLILGLVSNKPIKVLRPSTIKTSFPNFFEMMLNLGSKFVKG
tara:strand:- start:45 stop:1361 length:1317 start_codon:yes stop_codon:yes gene_type:complete